MSAGSAAPPPAVRRAVYALAAYSAVVVVYPAILLAANGWQGGGDYVRSLMRAAVVWILIRHLWRRDRWAWWLGVSLTASWVVLGLLGVLASPGAEAAPAGVGMPQGFALVAALSIVLLTVALTLLILPDSRRACHVGTGAAP